MHFHLGTYRPTETYLLQHLGKRVLPDLYEPIETSKTSETSLWNCVISPNSNLNYMQISVFGDTDHQNIMIISLTKIYCRVTEFGPVCPQIIPDLSDEQEALRSVSLF